LYALRDYYTQQPGQFTLVKCLACGLIYLNPRPTLDAIRAYYPSAYAPHVPLQKRSSWLAQKLEEYGLWKRCQPLLASQLSGRVLDVGCGTGQFLAAMRKYSNWELVGIDVNPQAIAFARDVPQLRVYVSRIEEIGFPDHTFDAVTMWDTLEHVHDPHGALLETYRVLKPGGHLLLRVPSFNSLDACLFGPFWAGLDPPRHLTVFSRETLERLLAEAGFVIERLWCMSGSHASFVISLRFLLESQNPATGLRRWLLGLMTSLLGQALSAPYFFLVDQLLMGPEITVLARKRTNDDGDSPHTDIHDC
jgi:SAM-dependent methyltransferase